MTCSTCKWWRKEEGEGKCMSANYNPKSEYSSSAYVVSKQNFSCIHWEKWDWETTPWVPYPDTAEKWWRGIE